MKKHLLGMTLLLVMLVVIILAASPALAKPNYESESTAYYCSMAPPEQYWEAGKAVHGRNEHYTSIIVSDDPRFDGPNDVWGNWNINLDSMEGIIWGTGEQSIPDLNGGWKGRWHGKMHIAWPMVIRDNGHPLWLSVLYGTNHGYGDFQGLQLHFKIESKVEVYREEPVGLPCYTGQGFYDFGDGNGFVPVYFVLIDTMWGKVTGKLKD